jgi:cytochrome P450
VSAHTTSVVNDALAQQLLLYDRADHRRRREWVRPVVAPHRVPAATGWIARRIDQLLAQGSVECRVDVVDALARPLSLDVIGMLLGLSREDLPLVRAWSDAYTALVTGGRAGHLRNDLMTHLQRVGHSPAPPVRPAPHLTGPRGRPHASQCSGAGHGTGAVSIASGVIAERRAQIHARPGHPAIVTTSQAHSYAQLGQQMTAVQGRLDRVGLLEGELLAVAMDRAAAPNPAGFLLWTFGVPSLAAVVGVGCSL